MTTTKQTTRPALEILEEFFAPERDVVTQDVLSQVRLGVETILGIHEPITGEAYPEDRNRYCAVCMSGDGGSRRWPCPTVKAVYKYLGSRASMGLNQRD